VESRESSERAKGRRGAREAYHRRSSPRPSRPTIRAAASDQSSSKRMLVIIVSLSVSQRASQFAGADTIFAHLSALLTIPAGRTHTS
jgi:hypothetical protein